jgi:hypothetical protein
MPKRHGKTNRLRTEDRLDMAVTVRDFMQSTISFRITARQMATAGEP